MAQRNARQQAHEATAASPLPEVSVVGRCNLPPKIAGSGGCSEDELLPDEFWNDAILQEGELLGLEKNGASQLPAAASLAPANRRHSAPPRCQPGAAPSVSARSSAAQGDNSLAARGGRNISQQTVQPAKKKKTDWLTAHTETSRLTNAGATSSLTAAGSKMAQTAGLGRRRRRRRYLVRAPRLAVLLRVAEVGLY